MIPEHTEEINGVTYRFRLSARAALDIKKLINTEVENRFDLDAVYEDEAEAEKMNAKVSRAIERITESNMDRIVKLMIRHDDLSRVPVDEADMIFEYLGSDDLGRIMSAVMVDQMPPESKKKTDKKAKPAKN